MQFFGLASLAFLPALVLSSPASSPANTLSESLQNLKRAAAPLPDRVSPILPRQSSELTTILQDLTQSLGAIEQLLSAQSLTNIEAVVTDLSTLFAAPTTNQTKELINTASGLLDSSAVSNLIGQLPGLLSSVSGLLTPALITNVTDILGNAHDLLTPTFVSETTGLINDVAPVSPCSYHSLNCITDRKSSWCLLSRKSFRRYCPLCLDNLEAHSHVTSRAGLRDGRVEYL
jgi:hypothetical protein